MFANFILALPILSLKINTTFKKFSLPKFVTCLNYWHFPLASLGDINGQIKTNH